jgi:hypothetical protein
MRTALVNCSDCSQERFERHDSSTEIGARSSRNLVRPATGDRSARVNTWRSVRSSTRRRFFRRRRHACRYRGRRSDVRGSQVSRSALFVNDLDLLIDYQAGEAITAFRLSPPYRLTAINVSTWPAGTSVAGMTCAGQLTRTLAADVEAFGGRRYVILTRKTAPAGAGGSVVPE